MQTNNAADKRGGTFSFDCAYGCPVEATTSVIGGRWKGVILFHLVGGTRRFNQLRRMIPSVTQRMLTLQLRELEADGVVHRKVYAEVPPRVEYSLTDFGRTLESIVLSMHEWGEAYVERLHAPEDRSRPDANGRAAPPR
jgi:DNA-binding HxlR family transcriptional regulator